MYPSRHVAMSLALGGGVWLLTQSLLAGLLCFFSGFLIDVDHLIDYIINTGFKNFNFRNIYRIYLKMPKEYKENTVDKLYLIFHVGEIVILLWVSFIFFRNIYLIAITLAVTAHLIMDSMAGKVKPQTYFISYRMKKNFKASEFFLPRTNNK